MANVEWEELILIGINLEMTCGECRVNGVITNRGRIFFLDDVLSSVFRHMHPHIRVVEVSCV